MAKYSIYLTTERNDNGYRQRNGFSMGEKSDSFHALYSLLKTNSYRRSSALDKGEEILKVEIFNDDKKQDSDSEIFVPTFSGEVEIINKSSKQIYPFGKVEIYLTDRQILILSPERHPVASFDSSVYGYAIFNESLGIWVGNTKRPDPESKETQKQDSDQT